jgi:ABC transport system ATP-binding/permease protein
MCPNIDLEKTVSGVSRSESTNKKIVEIFVGDEYFDAFDLTRFGKKKITFGRSPDNDIIINSTIVSSNHGYFVIEGNQCVIYDNSSTNGLLIDGKKHRKFLLEKEVVIRIDNLDNTLQNGVTIIFSNTSDVEDWIEVNVENLVTIGRSKENSICLKHVGISLKHAKIQKVGEVYFLYDLNSTNGIIVNGQVLHEKVELKNKDVFRIGNANFLFGIDKLHYKQSNSGIKLQAVNIVKTVKTKKGLLRISDDISLTIQPGEFVAIIGGSGAGKSTFMNCISGYNKASSGKVYIDDCDLYNNYQVFKSLIGYVPQQDIVFDNLTLHSMLTYTAKMRMPSDLSNDEIEKRIDEVIEIVELSERKNTFIRQLSGGQKKRASIAVELLADPSLFFLDEPTSGLDPGTERNLMYTLKKMSSFGKTIVLVTHTTLNLHLCDKIVFLGKGGKLCFYGTPDDALKFFSVENLVDVYNMLSSDTQLWFEKFKLKLQTPNVNISSVNKVSEKKVNVIKQFIILSKRYAELILNDKRQLMLLLLQAPLLGLFMSVVVNSNDIFKYYDHTKAILFTMICSAIWMGLLNSIQEICKERVVFKREYAANLRIIPYILSKVIIQAVVSFVQSVLFIGTIWILFGLPKAGILTDWVFLEMVITTFIVSLAASSTGLLVSSLSPNTEIAMITAPLLLVPQMLFSGMLFKLDGVIKTISYLIISRWGMEAYGSIADLNSLPLEVQKDFPMIVRTTESFFEVTKSHLLLTWGILVIYTSVLILITIVYQKVQVSKNG